MRKYSTLFLSPSIIFFVLLTIIIMFNGWKIDCPHYSGSNIHLFLFGVKGIYTSSMLCILPTLRRWRKIDAPIQSNTLYYHIYVHCGFLPCIIHQASICCILLVFRYSWLYDSKNAHIYLSAPYFDFIKSTSSKNKNIWWRIQCKFGCYDKLTLSRFSSFIPKLVLIFFHNLI